MDYIIFGLGLGATLTLVGWALREWGAAFRDRSSSSEQTVLSGYELVNQMAWQRFCRACGAVLAIFGLLVLLATIIATGLGLPNATGATIVLATIAVCAVATLVWLGLFLHRFGARGILRPKSMTPSSLPSVSKAESHHVPGHVKGSAPVMGPPLPGGGTSLAPGQPLRPGVTALQDEDDADAEPVEDHIAAGAESDEVVEQASANERAVTESQPDDESRTAEAMVADDDAPDEPVDDANEVERERDILNAEGPNAGKRRIVMLTTKDDGDDEQPEPDDTGSEEGGSTSTRPVKQVTDTISIQRVQPQSGTDAESDHQSASEGDIPSSSGRAEAVRKLRQRRIKRLTRDSSTPE